MIPLPPTFSHYEVEVPDFEFVPPPPDDSPPDISVMPR